MNKNRLLKCGRIHGAGASNAEFISGDVCSESLNGLRYSHITGMKTRVFFGKRSPQTFVNCGLIEGATSRFVRLQKFSLNFSSLSFAI